MSNHTYSADIPGWYVGLICLLLYPAGLLSVIANACVIIGTAKSRHLKDNSSIIIGSMALVDMLIGIFAFEFSISMWRTDNSTLYCDFQVATAIALVEILLSHIILMNIEKYLYIAHPFIYQRYITRTITLVCLTAIWIVFLTLSVLINRIPMHISTSCIFIAPNVNISIIVMFVILTMPTIVISGLFYQTYRIISRQKLTIQNQVTNVHAITCRHVKKSDKKGVKMMVIIMVCFVCFWTSALIIPTILIGLHVDVDVLLTYVMPWLYGVVFIEPVVNPFIYYMYNIRYKNAILRLFVPRNRVGQINFTY